jgi:hypothetical protein
MTASDKDDMWKAFEKIGEAMAEREKELDDMVEWCDYDMKLAVTRWVMKHIAEHGKDGGSYRYLIYERLGFGPDAYAPLCSDGLFISNEFDAEALPNARRMLEGAFKHGDDMKEYHFHELKEVLNCCDEPGCYEVVSCGFPTEDGKYRHTCYEHMTKEPWEK